MPLGAASNPAFFSSIVWGAWSVAIRSTVPSAMAACTAWRSTADRSGGFILASGPYSRIASSVSAM